MKGVTAQTIIFIVLAVAVAIVIVYFLWTKGWFPMFSLFSEYFCKTDIINLCEKGETEGWTAVLADFKSLCKRCYSYLHKLDENTFPSGSSTSGTVNIQTQCEGLDSSKIEKFCHANLGKLTGQTGGT